MKGADLVYGLWLLGLLSAVAYVGSSPDASPAPAAASASPQPSPPPAAGPAPESVVDATGRAVPRRAYARIASASSYADELLFALCEPERIVALSHYGRSHRPDAYRYGARALVSSPSDLERLMTLSVDLLLVNHLGAQSELARVRGAGIEVFDLGEMRGLGSLETNLYALASLLGERARGERVWQRFSQQLHAVARDVEPSARKPALYLAIYAGKLYGGTRGTSYHDVLTAAGLVDVAAERYRDWPEYDPEDVLRLDPPLIVTDTGMGSQLCENAWLKALRACASPGREGIVELASNLMGDPGLGMLDAALELHDRVYRTAAR